MPRQQLKHISIHVLCFPEYPIFTRCSCSSIRLDEHTFDSDAEDEVTGPSGTGTAAPGTSGRTADADSGEEGEGRGPGAGGARDPESIFKTEVGETFLRCLKLRFDQTNVVIELNSLKIAEDRTFADLARYLFTTLLSLCLPPPSWCSSEYKSLFPTSAPDDTTLQGETKIDFIGKRTCYRIQGGVRMQVGRLKPLPALASRPNLRPMRNLRFLHPLNCKEVSSTSLCCSVWGAPGHAEAMYDISDILSHICIDTFHLIYILIFNNPYNYTDTLITVVSSLYDYTLYL